MGKFEKEKNKKRFSILRVIIVTIVSIVAIIFIIVIVELYPLFESDRLIIPKNKNSKEGIEALKGVDIEQFCEPIPCHNTYVVHSKTKNLEESFEYCSYKGISGNIFFDFRDSDPSIGSIKYCGEDNKANADLTCNKGQLLTEYTLFDAFYFFPNFNKKEIGIKFYSCK